MDDTVSQIAALRKRQHALVQQLSRDNGQNVTVQALVKVDAELCAMLRAALSDHASTLGVSDAVKANSISPKD